MSEKLSDEQLRPVRGARDFFGPEKRLRDSVLRLLKSKFEIFGFEPLETPAMERLDVLASKFAGGEEILKETFKLKDQGDRELGLRYDLTVPLCRFVASNTRMQMPFKRYAIAPVWRDGPLKTGRYREFYQCDVDIVGASSALAEAELISLADMIFGELFIAGYRINISNRKVLDGILEYAAVPEQQRLGAMLSIDKLAKIGRGGVEAELSGKGISKESIGKLFELILEKGGNEKLISLLQSKLRSESGQKGLSELRELFSNLEAMNVKSAEFSPSLARGLNYYTGTVFEAYLANASITSSIAAGGRYDDLIGNFAGSSDAIPAVGISFGLDVICEALKGKENAGGSQQKKGAFLSVIVNENNSAEIMKFALDVASSLRKKEIPVTFDLMCRNIAKNLEFASKKNFRFAIIIGEKEMLAGKARLKDLQTGKEEELPLERMCLKLSA